MDSDPNQLSARTTPTWEVELLISGVAVFAMLQLPGTLDAAMLSAMPRFGNDWGQLLLMAYLYGRGTAMILAATFVLHLLLRARWIALVGMHSVFPGGIQWDKLRMGPIQREIERRRERTFPDVIERADNLATVVFAVGVTLTIMTVIAALVALAVSSFGLFIAARSDGHVNASDMILVMLAIVLLPISLANLVDRTFGQKLSQGGLALRCVRSILSFYARLGFSRANNPILTLLGSRTGHVRLMSLTSLVIMVALAGAYASFAMLQTPELWGSYTRFPHAERADRLDSAHYDDQRDPSRDAAVPYIQSMVVTSPYLRLLVPYRPDRDTSAMQQACPRGAADAQHAQNDLDCLASLHALTLDGKPLPAVDYLPAGDPRTNRPALLAMIDIRALARGRHELRIQRPPTLDEDGKRRDKDDPGYDRILFWR